MFCRNIMSFLCIFVAVVIATVHNDSHSITGSDAKVTVYPLTAENPESPRLEQNPTAAVDLPSLLDAGEGAIVTLVAGDTRLVAHRAVLAARSPVLAAMLGGGRPGASSSQVAVTGVEGAVLRQLLAYVYTLQAPHLPDMASQLLAAADKFGVSSLKEECARRVAMEMTVETAAAAAALAIRHSSDWLRQAAITYIKANQALVMDTQGWADVVFNQPSEAIAVIRLLSGLPAETSAPATGQSWIFSATEPHRDHRDQGQTPAPAVQTTATQHSTLTDDAAASLLHTPAPAASEATPTTQPHSSHSGLTPASAVQTTTARLTPTPDDTAAARLHASAPAASSAATPATQVHSSLSSHSGRTPASAAPATTSHPTATPDYPAICPLCGLSAEEKNRRLRKAAKEGAVEAVEALIAAGADVGTRDIDRCTALHWAARGGHVEVARRLLAAGAAVDARESGHRTPLYWAAAFGRTALVRLLVEEASADINAKEVDGRTPLHVAAAAGRAVVAAVLLQAGADRAAADNEGRTPLEMAREFNRQQLVDMLTTSS